LATSRFDYRYAVAVGGTIIIIIIRFHGLSKHSAFIAQLVAVHEFVQPVLEEGHKKKSTTTTTKISSDEASTSR